ncbi:hypothetical protein P691DRAFT_778134 [Macrolepiota fuliginosa MF-IS2]|uniref:DUF6533 domain-containing protein n=1 Tax=Macrolepiota fuliginosa MF-IS2 TaxID=1400762 RepID=A0A9P6C0H6_9AGAR|nr:hypothetical protein P691DRAFT_778134 [Macrolepiota fuliginosa MF-IS2]
MDSVSEIDTLFVALRQAQILQYVKAAMLTAFAFDYLSMLPREITSVWMTKWTGLSFFYMFCRYIVFVDLLLLMLMGRTGNQHVEACLPLVAIDTWIASLAVISAILCFCLRAYALLGTTKTAAAILGFLAASVILSALGIDILATFQIAQATHSSEIKQLDSPIILSLFPPCSLITADSAQVDVPMIGNVILLIVDVFLMALVLWAKTRRYRTSSSMLVNNIYQDSLYYFVLNLMASVVALILHYEMPGLLNQAGPMSFWATYVQHFVLSSPLATARAYPKGLLIRWGYIGRRIAAPDNFTI